MKSHSGGGEGGRTGNVLFMLAKDTHSTLSNNLTGPGCQETKKNQHTYNLAVHRFVHSFIHSFISQANIEH